MNDHSDLIERLRALPTMEGSWVDTVRNEAVEALSSQSLSLSEAREEIERLKGLVAGIRECPQEPSGVDGAARRSYEYEGDRKGITYVGWDNEPEEVRAEWRASVRVAIEAHQEAMVSWKLVPLDPTPDMYIKGGVAIADAKPTAETYADEASACYRAMLDAAPALENGPAGLADATKDPTDPSLSSLRKGAEVMRDAIEDAIEKLNTYRGAAVQTVIDQLEAALVSGSREDGDG